MTSAALMKMKKSSAAALGLLVLGAAGCGDWTGTSDPHHPGAALGTFRVSAAQTMTTCGEGALGSTSSWEFDVKLSRGETTLFWDSGVEIIPGSLAADRVSFAFETGVLREEVKDIHGAVDEYLAALWPEGTDCCRFFEGDQRSLRRLAQLLGRERVRVRGWRFRHRRRAPVSRCHRPERG